jgi:polar amino acid transport system substrate-binding protein
MPNKTDPRIADLVAAGKVRVALYVPQYTTDPATGELKGWAADLARALGTHFGIEGVPVGHPTPPAAMASLKSGDCDAAILGVEPARATEVDYSPPIVEADYTMLVPAPAQFCSVADADRPGVRIAVVRNHASTMKLARTLKHATLVYADMPDQTFELLCSGQADVFASVREILLRYCAQLPGSRVIAERYGFNSLAVAVPKGLPGRHERIR